MPYHRYLKNAISVELHGAMNNFTEQMVRFTGPLWGESIGHRWNPLTKASDAELTNEESGCYPGSFGKFEVGA